MSMSDKLSFVNYTSSQNCPSPIRAITHLLFQFINTLLVSLAFLWGSVFR